MRVLEEDAPNQLEEIVREHLECNRLPAIVSRQVKAGYGGVGAKCEVCGSEIELRHVEYEAMPTPPPAGFYFIFDVTRSGRADASSVRRRKRGIRRCRCDDFAAPRPYSRIR
jgi:hypothetical protein